MEIAFRTKALRTVCLSGEAMDNQYGAERAALLKNHIADMRAAACLGDMPLMTLGAVVEKPGNQAAISLSEDFVVIIKANQKKLPSLPDGKTDWSRVERVLVQRIECHGS